MKGTDENMKEAMHEIANAIMQTNSDFDWASVISAICSVISLIAIAILLKERKEKKRPYLQVSYELKRSSLVCIVIRNVGEVPAKLIKLEFNQSFVEQLPENAKKQAHNRENLNISIYPGQQWVLCLDIITPKALSYQNTVLEVTYMYTSKANRRKKHYSDTEVIDFNDYSSFLVYISEIDELRQELKKASDHIKESNKIFSKLIPSDTDNPQTQACTRLSDCVNRSIDEGCNPPIVIEKSEEQANADA